MDLTGMRVWPDLGGRRASEEPVGATEPIEYHEPSTESLASRCAGIAAEWGTDKVASVVEPALLYKDVDAHPLALALMTIDRYGPELFEWDPAVLRATMLRDTLQVSTAN